MQEKYLGSQSLVRSSDDDRIESAESEGQVLGRRNVKRAARWGPKADEILVKYCHNAQKIDYKGAIIEIENVAHEKRTIDAAKSRWRVLKEKMRIQSLAAAGNSNLIESEGALPKKSSQNKDKSSKVFAVTQACGTVENDRDSGTVTGAKEWSDNEIRLLISLCRDQARIQWKARVIPELRNSGVLKSEANIRNKWRRIAEVGVETVLATLQPLIAQSDSETAIRHLDPTRTCSRSTSLDMSREVAENTETVSAVVNNTGINTPTDPEILDGLTVRATIARLTEDLEGVSSSFKHSFLEALKMAVRKYKRKRIREIGRKIPHEMITTVSQIIEKWGSKTPTGLSRIGWLNALVYASAFAICQEVKQNMKNSPISLREQQWYKEKERQRKWQMNLIRRIEVELKRRAEGKRVSYRYKKQVLSLYKALDGRSTAHLKAKLIEFKQLSELIRERVNLRAVDKIRQKLRKQFALQPSLRILQKGKHQEQVDVPSDKDIIAFWKPLIGTVHNKSSESPELNEWYAKMQDVYKHEAMNLAKLKEMAERAVRKTKPWKAPGPDGVSAVWWKLIPSAREQLIEATIDIIRTGKFPKKWFCVGKTVLIYKAGDRKDPANYRPITCLNTCYKILTSTINNYLKEHLMAGSAISDKQQALKTEQWSCLHASLIDRALVGKALSQKKKPIFTAWVDFAKAFDSVPHWFLLWVLKAIRLPHEIFNTFSRLMRNWRTRFQVSHSKKETSEIQILNGIFQGDSLSPTLFVLTTSPISFMLDQYQRKGARQTMLYTRNHIFYVDDLKLFGHSAEHLNKMVQVLTKVKDDIGLKMNMGKCAQITNQGQLAVQNQEQLAEIPYLEDKQSYKYLGITQRLMNTDEGYARVCDTFTSKVRQLFRSNITYKQKRQGYLTICVAQMRYYYLMTCGGGQRFETGRKLARDLDIHIRKEMINEKIRVKTNSVARLYLPVALGGCGWASLEDELENAVVDAYCYLQWRLELQEVTQFFESEAKRGKRNLIKDAKTLFQEYKIVKENVEEKVGMIREGAATCKQVQNFFKDHMRAERNAKRERCWRSEKLASHVMSCNDIDLHTSFLWLEAGNMNSTAVRNGIVVQEGCLAVRAAPMMKDKSESMICRLCKRANETVDHVVSACAYWLHTLYIYRHDSIARVLHYWLCNKYNITPIHYSQTVPTKIENGDIEIYWNHSWRTKAIMKHNKPDIVLVNKKDKKMIIIEIGVAHVSRMRHQKLLKYQRYAVNSQKQPDENVLPYPDGPNLVGDLQDSLQSDVTFFAMIVGVCGEHLKETEKELEEIFGMNRKERQQILERTSRCAVLGTSRIVKNHMART